MLDARVRATEIRNLYNPGIQRFRALIIGNKGAGKTSLLKTARKPILLDMFDPQGEQVLSREIKRGEVLPVDYSAGTTEQWDWWRSDMEERKASGFFDHVGTYCLDSLTTWSEVLILKVLEDAIKESPKHTPRMEKQDWGTVLDRVRINIKEWLSLPCDVLVLGHIKSSVDDVTGRIGLDVMIQGSSDQRLPIYFSEVYNLDTAQKGDEIERFLITRNTGSNKCSTRLGGPDGDGEPFDLREPPDIKALMRKAGLDTTDLPPLIDPTESPNA